MFEVRADVSRNRLYVKLNGFIGLDDAKRALEQVVAEIGQLGPACTVVTDLSGLKLAATGSGATLEGIVSFFSARDVAAVARVVGTIQTPGLHQFLESAGKQPPYRVLYARSVAEADEQLDKLS